MWVRVLGSAAGGGFPQWNCNCPNCRAAREGSLLCRPRTQSSLAISADYQHWFLFNASPDIRAQIAAFPPLWPQGAVRHSAIEAIVLSDAELDHTLGLLSLREARSLRVYATPWVYTALSECNPILGTLRAYCAIDWRPVRLQETITLGEAASLQCQAFSTASAKPVAFATHLGPHPETSIGYRITDPRTGRSLVYLPAVQELNAEVRTQLQQGAWVFFDGTCWEDEELIHLGIDGKTSRAMGHLPVGGAEGSLECLAQCSIARKVYIHLNNTNPLLMQNSPPRRAVEARGIEVAFDGMEMEI
jgi:pyrroloquinoline quinone biosynthesis protein B